MCMRYPEKITEIIVNNLFGVENYVQIKKEESAIIGFLLSSRFRFVFAYISQLVEVIFLWLWGIMGEISIFFKCAKDQNLECVKILPVAMNLLIFVLFQPIISTLKQTTVLLTQFILVSTDLNWKIAKQTHFNNPH